MPHIELLSIDTEGSEHAVLASINFSAIRVDVVLVENSVRKKAISTMMRERGYAKWKGTPFARLDTVYTRQGFLPIAMPWWAVRCLPYC